MGEYARKYTKGNVDELINLLNNKDTRWKNNC